MVIEVAAVVGGCSSGYGGGGMAMEEWCWQ